MIELSSGPLSADDKIAGKTHTWFGLDILERLYRSQDLDAVDISCPFILFIFFFLITSLFVYIRAYYYLIRTVFRCDWYFNFWGGSSNWTGCSTMRRMIFNFYSFISFIYFFFVPFNLISIRCRRNRLSRNGIDLLVGPS